MKPTRTEFTSSLFRMPGKGGDEVDVRLEFTL